MQIPPQRILDFFSDSTLALLSPSSYPEIPESGICRLRMGHHAGARVRGSEDSVDRSYLHDRFKRVLPKQRTMEGDGRSRLSCRVYS